MTNLINTLDTAAVQLEFVTVDHANIHLTLQTQQQIWPRNPPDRDYIEKVLHPNDYTNVNWLVYHRGHLIGLTGVFTYDSDELGYDDDQSIWMDWFGILPQYRHLGLGQHILLATINYAYQLRRFKYFRLDTTDFPGRASTHLYDRVMPLREDYTAEPMPLGYHGLIYSYSLDGSPIRPWNNRLLDLQRYGAAEIEII